MQPTEQPAPIIKSERIVDLDILRGIALFGILVVNLEYFAHPFFSLASETELFPEWYNQASKAFIQLFFEGKFITLFSFLFGIGFYIFTERLKIKNLPVYPVFLRRMAVLLIIGMLHAWIFWSGDILAPYAIAGVLLMLFLKRKDKTIKIWMGILLGGITLFFIGLFLIISWAMTIPDVAEDLTEQFMQVGVEYEELNQRGYEVNTNGSFTEIMEYRAEERSFVWVGMLMSPAGLPYILTIFLFGLFIGRRGILDNPQAFRDYFIHSWKRNFIIGFLFACVYVYTYNKIDPVFFNDWYILHIISFYLSTPVLCFSYVGFILMLIQKSKDNTILNAFAPVGRMALTNYLIQSVICTTFFFGYGLGYYGELSPVMAIPLSIALFAVQVWYSKWYLNRFKMGPMERLWRMATYLKRV